MAQRGRVEHEIIAARVECQLREVRHVATQVLRQIVQHGPGRTDGGRPVFEAEPVERRDFEMVPQCELRGFRGEGPVVVAMKDPTPIRRGSIACASTVWGAGLRRGVCLGSPRRRGSGIPSAQ